MFSLMTLEKLNLLVDLTFLPTIPTERFITLMKISRKVPSLKVSLVTQNTGSFRVTWRALEGKKLSSEGSMIYTDNTHPIKNQFSFLKGGIDLIESRITLNFLILPLR